MQRAHGARAARTPQIGDEDVEQAGPERPANGVALRARRPRPRRTRTGAGARARSRSPASSGSSSDRRDRTRTRARGHHPPAWRRCRRARSSRAGTAPASASRLDHSTSSLSAAVSAGAGQQPAREPPSRSARTSETSEGPLPPGEARDGAADLHDLGSERRRLDLFRQRAQRRSPRDAERRRPDAGAGRASRPATAGCPARPGRRPRGRARRPLELPPRSRRPAGDRPRSRSARLPEHAPRPACGPPRKRDTPSRSPISWLREPPAIVQTSDVRELGPGSNCAHMSSMLHM